MGEASATDSGSITCSFAHGYWQVGRAGSQGSRRGRDRLGTQPAGGAAQVDVQAARQPGLRDPGTCEELTGRHAISLLNRSVLSTKRPGRWRTAVEAVPERGWRWWGRRAGGSAAAVGFAAPRSRTIAASGDVFFTLNAI